jgi:hypothetical protein
MRANDRRSGCRPIEGGHDFKAICPSCRLCRRACLLRRQGVSGLDSSLGATVLHRAGGGRLRTWVAPWRMGRLPPDSGSEGAPLLDATNASGASPCLPLSACPSGESSDRKETAKNQRVGACSDQKSRSTFSEQVLGAAYGGSLRGAWPLFLAANFFSRPSTLPLEDFAPTFPARNSFCAAASRAGGRQRRQVLAAFMLGCFAKG